jgi:hypothetical protein
LAFAYDAEGVLESITDLLNRTVCFTYSRRIFRATPPAT